MAKRKFKIKGQVKDQKTGRGIGGLEVQAWDADLIFDDFLGKATTNEEGCFTINFDETYYQELCFDRKPDIYFKVFKENKLIKSTEYSVLWNVSNPDMEINLEVSVDIGGVFQKQITVKGTVSTDAKRLPSNLTVQIVDQHIQDETVLAYTSLDINGMYKTVVSIKSAEQPAIIARVIDKDGNVLATSVIVFEIIDNITLDIFIPAGSMQRESEYIEIQQSIRKLIGDKSVADLTKEQMDLIAGKTRLSAHDLGLYQKAHVIAHSENISSEILYGLFRKGLQPRLTSLYEMSSINLRDLIVKAVEENIIPPQDENEVAAALEKLQRFVLNNELNTPLLTNGPTFYELLDTSGVSEDVINQFTQIVKTHTGSIDQLWQDLEDGKHGIEPDDVSQLRFSIQAGSLSMAHLPMTNSLFKLKNTGEISELKELVNWDKDQWVNYLTELEKNHEDIIPEHVPGNTPDEKKSNYALAMSRILEQTYPTESLSAKIETDVYSHLKSFVTFTRNNTSFQIGETNIDSYLKENKDALKDIQDPDQFILDLKKLQLQYMLSPGFDRYESIKTLQKLRIDSSSDIVNKGWKKFSKHYAESGGSLEMAGVVYEMASHNVAMMHNIQFIYGRDHNLKPYVMRDEDYRDCLESVLDDPNLSTLFGSQDFCKCKHCLSIYGPAAYMVDILQFLKIADTVPDSDNSCLDLLMKRRPDLGHIDLNCPNTNIALPYIDILNEIFENAIYKQTSNSPDYSENQTTGTSEELIAHPEHIREEVYGNTLKTAYYPWNLPFDLWTEEGRVYLEHLKLPRYKIMDTFLPETGYVYLNYETIANEILRINMTDREIITSNFSATHKQQWGLASRDKLVSTLKNPDNLLNYSGLEHSDLNELLKTWFINPDCSIKIDFDAENLCDLKKATIKNITENSLMKILRFTRLKNKLEWSIRELDMALRAFKTESITPDTLLKLSHILRLKDLIIIPLHQILTFWGNIFTGHLNDDESERSPYELLFLNKSVINPVDQAFELNDTMDQLAVTSNKINDHIATIQAGFGISSANLNTLINEVLDDNNLTLENLSNLYRHVVLAKAMKITITELIMLKSFTSMDPFKPGNTENTIIFIKEYQKIKKSKVKLVELEYLLQKEYDISNGVDLSEDSISNALSDIHRGQKKIVDENQITPDPQGEITSGKLASILSEDDLNTTVSILEQLTKPETEEVIETQSEFIRNKLWFFLTDTEDTVRKLVKPFDLTDKQSRYEHILEDLLNYLIKTGTKEFLKQKMSSNLNLNVDVADTLLFHKIMGPDDSTRLAGDTLQDDDFVKTDNESINKADFPHQFNTYVLLHKTALILRKFKVTTDEHAYLFAGASDYTPVDWPGWFDFNNLPVKTNGTPQDQFNQLLRLIDLFSFYHLLPSSDENLFEIMKDAFNPDSNTTIDQLLETISSITGWEFQDLKELSNSVFGFEKISYKDEIPFIRLESCMDILKISGAKAEDVNKWVEEGLNSAISEQIVHSVKSHYNDKEWLEIARPLRNHLREKQKLSLTGWLTHNHKVPEFNSKLDLYNYYLVDPEMSACMLTSRIRLALSSIQLFVKRCLMNLETEVDISNEDLEHWNQWKWMKTYRLWEANRKIFCYPENWIEPELRDNKTVFFKELEQELEQGEVNNENVEKAYINYLTKLEAVSNIDIMGICRARENQPGTDAYYIFGRTVGKPNILYFRKFQTDKTWTSWEKIDIDFEGDHLIPVVYNNKLHIFWPVFTTKTLKTEIPDKNEKGSEPIKYREIQMAWSVYSNGKWSAKRVTEETIDECENSIFISYKDWNISSSLFNDGTNRFFVEKEIKSQNRLTLSVYSRRLYSIWALMVNNYLQEYYHVGSFLFAPSMKVTINDTNNSKRFFDLVDNSYLLNQKYIETFTFSEKFTNPFTLQITCLNNKIPTTIFNKTPNDLFSITHVDDLEDNLFYYLPFIYQDINRIFFIKPKPSLLSFNFNIHNHYHPYVNDFMNVVCANGVDGLLDPEYDDSNPNSLPNKLRRQQIKNKFFTDIYGERALMVHEDLPIDEIDFSPHGAYSIYNWELFLHIPMLIADKLSLNQKFEEAQKWYHYIFDPTDTSSDYEEPQRFWKIKPFIEIYEKAEDGTPASIQELMKLINEGDKETEAQVDAWRDDPFNPHLVARMRILAYMKNIVMKYIDNLLKWADMLFRQDTMETTNEATQLYMLAWYILGEEPRMVEGKEPEAMTYYELEEQGIDDFSNALVTLETKLVSYIGTRYLAGFQKFKDFILNPNKIYENRSLYNNSRLWFNKTNVNTVPELLEAGQPQHPPGNSKNVVATQQIDKDFSATIGIDYGGFEHFAPKAYWEGVDIITHPEWIQNYIYQIVKTLYFCIPHNDTLLEYWNTVKDRMFKLRNCMNIEGIVRQLPLFDPPLDPGMLVRATASGMDLSSTLNNLNASLPNYRFIFMLEKAKEFAGIVRNAGNSLLSVLEKRDAEALALLRANNEINLLEAIKQIKKYQLEEAQQNRNALQESWNMADNKFNFYNSREKINPAEGFQIGLIGTGIALQLASQIINLSASAEYIYPDVAAGSAGTFGSPLVVATIGGQQFGNVASAIAKGINDLAGTFYQGASVSGILANLQRRAEDWDFLRDQAETEKEMIQHQMDAALIRYRIAQADIDNHEKQTEQRKAEHEYMKSKFTNKELYDWMTGQISSIYFQAYQIAFDLAKRAERSYKYELAESNDSFISYGYWDSLKKGLLAGEKLYNDLMRMEASYLEKNKRTYEITKHVSLRMLNPFALMQLHENGKCYFNLPEEIFDLDHPGHYKRRIKSVSITIPCVTGPYSGVNAKLTLLNNTIRKTNKIDDSDSYPKNGDNHDTRFIDNLAMIQSIATSSAQNDSGLFTMDFNDARYLPFEGAGVISNWHLELPGIFKSFDYDTISDVIITLNYTAKDGGEVLKAIAENHLKTFTQSSDEVPLERLFSMKNEFSEEWYQFLNPSEDEDNQKLDIHLKKSQFPFMFNKDIIHVSKLDIILQLNDPTPYSTSNPIILNLTLPDSGDKDITLNPAPEDKLLNSQPVNFDLAASFTIENDEITITFGTDEENIKTISEALKTESNGHFRLNKEQVENLFLITHYYTESKQG